MNILTTLTRKFIFVSLLFLFFIVATFYVSFIFTAHIDSDAIAVNMAGQTRYRAFELSWLAERLVEKNERIEESQDSLRLHMSMDMQIFETILTKLKKGAPDLGVRPIAHYGDAERIFQTLEMNWEQNLKPVLLAVKALPENASEKQGRRILANYNSLIHLYIENANRLVSAYEIHNLNEIQRFQDFRKYSIVFFAIMSAFVFLYLRKTVVLPVELIKKAAEQIEMGNLDTHIEYRSSDDIGRLAGTMNSTIWSLKGLIDEKISHLNELHVLNEVSRAANKTLSPDIMLNTVMDSLVVLEPLRLARKGAIFLLKGTRLKLAVSRSFCEEQKAGCSEVAMGECLCGICAEQKDLVLSNSNLEDKRHIKTYPGTNEHGHIILPLKSAGIMHGVLCLYLPCGTILTDREIDLFRSIADVISIALHNSVVHDHAATFEQAIESSNDMIAITTLQGEITHVNQAGVINLGYARDELVGQSIFSIALAPEDDMAVKQSILLKTMEGGWAGELIIKNRKGAELPVFLSTSVVRDSDNRPSALMCTARNMAGQKLAEMIIREREERLRAILDNTTALIYLKDPEGRYMMVNRKFEEVFAITDDGILGRSDYDIFQQHLADGLRRHDIKALSADGPLEFEEEVMQADGLHTYISTKFPLRTPAGRIYAVCGISTDITERKRMEEALRFSARQWQTTFDSMNEAICIIDRQGKILQCNRAMEAYVKVGRPQVVGRHCYTIIHGTTGHIAGCPFLRMKESGKREQSEFQTSSGWLEIIVDPIFDADGQISGAVHIMNNITERKLAEKNLRQSEEKFRQLIENAPVGIIISTPEGKVIDINPAVLEMTGYASKQEFVDKPAAENWYDPEERREFIERLKEGPVKNFEVRQKKNDGALYWVSANSISLDMADGKRWLISTLIDITDRRTMDERLQRFNEELMEKVRERTAELEASRRAAEAASQAKSDFLANMSHELRTPLNSILGFSEVIRDGLAGPVSDEQKDFLNDINTSGRHLLNLINDILDLSKVEAGKMELALGRFGLTDALKGSLIMFREKAMKHRIKMSTEIEKDVGEIVGDEMKIKQVLFNLLSNAFKFTPDGGSVRVCARMVQGSEFEVQGKRESDLEHGTSNMEQSTDFVEIAVEDSGIGISDEDQERLFQPFQQLETTYTKKHAGTGLGLHLCRCFIELHRGRIWVESELGKGSRFAFVIPARQGQQQ